MRIDRAVDDASFHADVMAAYDAIPAPGIDVEDMVRGVQVRVRGRHRGRLYVRATLGICLVVVLVMVSIGLIRSAFPHVPVTTSPGRNGALASGGIASCAYQYDRHTLTQRDWAADATVKDLKIKGDTAQVVLAVHEWYRGGAGNQATVTMPSPWIAEDAPPSYGIGTRLLASGDRDNGVYIGWSCGFSRYYDPKTAQHWEKYFG